jgi:hypothetical protein
MFSLSGIILVYRGSLYYDMVDPLIILGIVLGTTVAAILMGIGWRKSERRRPEEKREKERSQTIGINVLVSTNTSNILFICPKVIRLVSLLNM